MGVGSSRGPYSMPSMAGIPPVRPCRRNGCPRTAMRRSRQRRTRVEPYCGRPCKWWVRIAEALSEGGAALGRDADMDSRQLLWLASELDRTRWLRGQAEVKFNELRDAYQRD
ncbi:protein of unknown function [Streptomyces murinus]